MTIEKALERVSRYLERPLDRFAGTPFIVSVNSRESYGSIRSALSIGCETLQLSALAPDDDSLPVPSALWDRLDAYPPEACVLLLGADALARLRGERELKRMLATLGGRTYHCRTVILLYGAQPLLREAANDPKTGRSYALISDEPDEAAESFTFIRPELGAAEAIHGLRLALARLEGSAAPEHRNVLTAHSVSEFPDSLIRIGEVSGAYDACCLKDARLRTLPASLGNEEFWAQLHRLLTTHRRMENVVQSELGSGVPEALFANWSGWTREQRRLYLIWLKLVDCEERNLSLAARQADSPSALISGLYRGILELEHTDPEFRSRYLRRRELLRAVREDSEAAHDFCTYSRIRREERIYYLTDNTPEERQEIILCLDGYIPPEEGPDPLIDTLRTVYPALADYLGEYHMGNAMLDDYFRQYRLLKLTNRITDRFMELVDIQADRRDYAMLLPHRSTLFERLEKQDACVYFMDAMGAEYLPYIQRRCAQLDLMLSIRVGRCNLPSITACNKEFLDELEPSAVFSVKELDAIKHEGKNDYDFQRVPQPIHLCRELEIIDEVLLQLRRRLKSGEFSRAIMVADHGASRLAVTRRSTIRIEADSRGTHGGRCCAYTEGMAVPPHAVVEDGWCVLAGYDRFRGGRAASVETHGGATLEEVAVPVIEICRRPEDLEVTIVEKTVKLKPRKPLSFTLFCKAKLPHLRVLLGENLLEGESDDGQTWRFSTTAVTKNGTYSLEVYSGDTLIKKGLHLIVEKGMKERDFF